MDDALITKYEELIDAKGLRSDLQKELLAVNRRMQKGHDQQGIEDIQQQISVA